MTTQVKEQTPFLEIRREENTRDDWMTARVRIYFKNNNYPDDYAECQTLDTFTGRVWEDLFVQADGFTTQFDLPVYFYHRGKRELWRQ
jgi:hypothetical protein